MKLLVGLVLAIVLATPAPAAAAGFPCALGSGPGETAEDERIWDMLADGGSDAIHEMLGDQAAGYWSSPRETWAMGIAPGPMSLDEARTAIEELLTDRVGAADAALVMGRLGLYPMPYGDNELGAIADALEKQMEDEFGDDFTWYVDRGGCLDGEAWRVQVGLYTDATPEQIAAVRELIAPYGDPVRLYLDGLVDLPTAGGGTAASRLRSSFVRLRSPKRCVSARTIQLKTRRSARRVIRRITVTVAGKRRALTGNRLTIRLRRGVTPVRVVIRVGDGSRLAHTYRFRRCAQASTAAVAQSGGPCAPDGDGPYDYQDRLGDLIGQSSDQDPYVGDAEQAAMDALGAQFGGLWFSTPDQGWAIGVAPGPVALEQAHDAIVTALGSYYGGDDAAYLAGTLHVYAQLYGYAELRGIQDAISDQVDDLDLGVGMTIGVGCEDGEDAWRVRVELFNDSTPEIAERVRELIAPYCDRVRLVFSAGGPPELTAARFTPRKFVRFPRPGRCVRHAKVRIRLRGGARRHVRRVTVTVAGHRHRVGRRGFVVRLRRKVTRVRITVRLRSGEPVRRTYTFRRC
jgi:hypothetical protein